MTWSRCALVLTLRALIGNGLAMADDGMQTRARCVGRHPIEAPKSFKPAAARGTIRAVKVARVGDGTVHARSGLHVSGLHVPGPHVSGPHVSGPHVSGPHVSGPTSVPTRRGFGCQYAHDSHEARRRLARRLFEMAQEQF